MQTIIDPRTIPQSDFPFIVLSEQTNDIVSFLIDWRTKGSFDHAMVAIDQGKFVCQGFGGYKEIPMDTYLKKGGILKFVKVTSANDAYNQAFRASVLNRLASPWWHRCYDFIGIIGQAIGMPWIHTPGLYYCSVDAIRHMKNACLNLPQPERDVILQIPTESSPQDLSMMVKNNPDVFPVYGEWSADEGIVL